MDKPPTTRNGRSAAEHAGEPIPPHQKLALSASEAAEVLSIGKRKLWLLTNQNAVPHVRLDGRIVYPRHELQRWLSEHTRGGDD